MNFNRGLSFLYKISRYDAKFEYYLKKFYMKVFLICKIWNSWNFQLYVICKNIWNSIDQVNLFVFFCNKYKYVYIFSVRGLKRRYTCRLFIFPAWNKFQSCGLSLKRDFSLLKTRTALIRRVKVKSFIRKTLCHTANTSHLEFMEKSSLSLYSFVANY